MAKNPPDLPLNLAPVPAVHRAKPRKRDIRRNSSGNVADAIGPITPDCEIFALTNGQFSMIDILAHVLDATGPASIDLATWTAADGDLRRAHAFLLDGRVKSIRLIVDPSFRSRQPAYCNTLIELFGNDAIRTLPLHGKDGWQTSVETRLGELRTDTRDIRERTAVIEERVSHLPTKAFVVTALLALLALIAALIAYQDQIQKFVQ